MTGRPFGAKRSSRSVLTYCQSRPQKQTSIELWMILTFSSMKMRMYMSSRTSAPSCLGLNTLRPRQNGCLFPDDIFKCIFLNENIWISIAIPLKFVSNGLINNILALVQIIAWYRAGDKALSEPMMTHMYASLGLNEFLMYLPNTI